MNNQEEKTEKPVMRNLCPYKVFRWHKICNESEMFTKEEFLISNPDIWEIEEWNNDKRNKRITIS